MGSLHLETDPGHPRRRVFVGFHYQAPYTALYGDRIREAVARDGWHAVMPLGDDPWGLLLDRISVMIRSAERAVYELGGDSGNVWFELGMSLALRQPVVLTSDRQPSELVDILRTPWLSLYSTGDDCVEGVRGFLRLPDPPPMVPGRRASDDPTRVTVVGEGRRADTVAAVLRAAGREVSTVIPASVRSPAEALEISESSGTIVAIRPPGVRWNTPDAVAPLLMVGAAFGVGRNVVLAAGDSEAIPSDCTQLLVRASTEGALGEKVLEALDRPRPGPPPSGTMRPRITGALERMQATNMVQALSEAPAVALDAEPGYGKTTVLTQVAHQIQGPVAWVTLENDWSMPELVERLAAAVGEHAPGFGWKALAAIRHSSDDPSRNPPADSVRLPSAGALAQLIADGAERAGAASDVVLIVDDAQKAKDEAGRLLASLILLAPPWLRIVVSGRGLPAEIARLSRTGRLRTWAADDLRFSEDETRTYLRTSGREADEERVGLLQQRTEGWPAALAVIRAWLDTHHGATTDQLRTMARGDRYHVYQIFATDYFTGLGPAIREDLFLTALPLRLDAEVAERLYGPRGPLRIRELAQGPYFINEEAAGSFRVHSLFREFLTQRWIEERGAASLLEQRSQLARWYRETGDIASAYQIACEAQDWETAVAAIDAAIRPLANQADSYFVLEVLQRLPEDRIRQSRPLWESWVRALSHLGDPRALSEATALAEAPGSISEQGLADLLLAELRHDHGELSDEELAVACDAIALRLTPEDPRLAVQARFMALSARAVRSGSPEQWPRLLEVAREVATEAKAAAMPSVAAIALAQAGDLAGRIFQNAFMQDLATLRFAASFGAAPPLEQRLKRARQLLAVHDAALQLYKEAFSLAEETNDPLTLAHVQLSYSRSTTAKVMDSVLRTGKIAEAERGAGEAAIQYALTAAAAYAERGVLRSVAVCFNAAAEAASVLNDHQRRDGFCDQSASLVHRSRNKLLVVAA